MRILISCLNFKEGDFTVVGVGLCFLLRKLLPGDAGERVQAQDGCGT